MQERKTSGGLTLRAVAGSYVVLLAMNMERAACKGLRGFAIHRTDHTEEEAFWLEGMKVFEETDPKLAPGARHSSRQQPFQDFSWADYSAKPGRTYTYKVLALHGPPSKLEPLAQVEVTVTTESPEAGDHDVYFNRGAAASQEYARRFGNRKPGSQGGTEDPAWVWLSRGAHEAILEFIERAKDHAWGLRVGAYEFRLPSVLQALRSAHVRGADVQIVYDAGHDFPREENREEADSADIEALCHERQPRPEALSHNKFIVLLNGGKAVAVLTGSTNFSEGGVFGQSNVVHVVEEPRVAEAYLDYWEQLKSNPHRDALAPKLTNACPIPADGSQGTSTFFSPRSSLDALEFYAGLAAGAKDAVLMTFAFGMNAVFQDVYKTGKAPLRYALFEKLLGPVSAKTKGRPSWKR